VKGVNMFLEMLNVGNEGERGRGRGKKRRKKKETNK